MIELKNWYGRLGNNIKQLQNVLHIALYYKEPVKICKHEHFHTSMITKEFQTYTSKKTIIDAKYNFYNRTLLSFPAIVFETNKDEVQQILRNSFIIKQENIIKIPETTVVVHIRSGDIFSKRPHPGYVPKPLCYYTSILNKYKYSKIVLISEDTKNPVVNELLKIYPNSSYKKQSLKKDIEWIIGATHIIVTTGSFVPSLLVMNPYVKKIHTSCPISLNEYYKQNKPWENTTEQRDLILTYS